MAPWTAWSAQWGNMFSSHIYLEVIFLPRRRGQNPHPSFSVNTDSVRSLGSTEHHTKKETCRVLGGKSFSSLQALKTILSKHLNIEHLQQGSHSYLTLILRALSKHTRVDQSGTRRTRNTKKKISRTCTTKEKEITCWTRKQIYST